MPGHQLKAEIIVSGKEDSSLIQLSNKLQNMADQASQLSEFAMEFLTDSANVYREYEDGILETRSVLQSTYKSTAELDRDMQKIESAAQNWAETTIFTTADVSNAIANAAHAGWDYNKIMEGMPSAMLVAQAGHLELADGVDYLTRMMYATGTQFDESKGFVNEWAKAADIAATDIDNIGKSFLKLGTASRLADTNEELFTFFTILANSGTRGTEAGTALRNVMARLAAPTSKAEEAMEALGISEEEAEEALFGLDESAAAAYEQLEAMGFSAYDQQGNLRPFIDQLTDLNMILSVMDEKSRNDILKTLFGTKSFQYAMTLLDAANSGELISVYDAILGVKDTDYAQDKANTVMSGLTGATELLNSKWQEFMRKVGEVLSGPLEGGMEIIGDMVSALNNMDPIVLDAMTGMLSTIALTAPALSIGAGALKIIGGIIGGLGLSNVFPWMLLASTIVGAGIALGDLSDKLFDENWGNMDLDTDPLNTYMRGIDDTFRTLSEDIEGYNTAADKAIENYTKLTSGLSNNLLTKVITGTQLTDEDKHSITLLGNQIYTQLTESITNDTASNMTWLQRLFGFGDSDPLENEAYGELIDAENTIYGSLLQQAQELGTKLGKMISDAMADGIVNGEEYQALKQVMDEMNQLIAMENTAKRAGQLERELHEAQTVSYDSFESWIGEKYDTYRQNVAQEEANFAENYGYYRSKYMQLIEKGEINPKTGRKYTNADWWYVSANMKRQHNTVLDWYNDSYAQTIDRGLETLLNSADTPMYNAFKYLMGSDGSYNAEDFVNDPTLASGIQSFARMDAWMMGVLRPYAELMGIDLQQLRENADMLSEAITTNAESVQASTDVWDMYNAEKAQEDHSGNPEIDRNIGAAVDVDTTFWEWFKTTFTPGTNPEFDRNMGAATDVGGSILGTVWNLLGGRSASAEGSVRYTDNGSSDALKAHGVVLFGDSLTQNVSVTDGGSARSLRSSIESTFSSAITQRVNVVRSAGGIASMFAEGGRATEASIFGEAGAEWAIPEQHTERTADLLTSAAKASGFTWGELLSRNGGLNGGARSGSTTLVYSPTINGGSGDIDRILRDDKERLERWWQERSMREAAVSYA